MRKLNQHRNIPPTLKHNGRLNNSVAPHRNAEWRKLRSRRFVQAKAIANSLSPNHPAFDEARGLITFGYLISREPETAFEEYASNLLHADKIDHLNRKFPRQNFASIADWAVAVAEEVQSVLLPARTRPG